MKKLFLIYKTKALYLFLVFILCCVNVSAQNAKPSSSNIVINEIMASNIDVYRDPSTNFGSWVELYNPTSSPVVLGGLYVSDDVNNLKKNKLVSNYGTLPANGFAVLNFDHHEVWTQYSYRQIDDKLDCDGGVVIISDGTNIFAQQEYPKAIGRISFARLKDGGSEWGTMGIPSPGKSNSLNGGFATEQLAEPVISHSSGMFSSSILLKVNIPSGCTLKYTTDGTSPSSTNGKTSGTGEFSISANCVYRFRLFKNGYLPSGVVTRTFIKSSGVTMPIISIVTDKANIDGSNDYGLFMQGQNGRPGNGQYNNCNWNMDWDRPVNFEYITTDNECVVSQECDFSTCGGWSRAWNPHSFKLKANKVYDFRKTFDYQFFDEKPFLNNKTLQVRNGGNDTGCRIKDAAIQQIAARSGLYVDYQSWQPARVYFNGSFYAVLNVREPNNKHYAYANYGIDTDEMEQFEMSPDSGYVQMVGTGEYFKQLYDLSAYAESQSVYEEIRTLLDIDEYINYMAVELYTGNWDWPQNNVKAFRDVNDGKFHFVLFDMDGSLSTNTPFSTFAGKKTYTFDGLHGYDYSRGVSIEGTRRTREIEVVTLFLNLLKNETFKKKFIDTYCLVGGSVYTPERVRAVVDEMASILSSGGVNPYSTANSLISSFSESRQSSMISHLKSYFRLSGTSQQNVVLSSDVEGAKIFVNDIEVPTGKFSGTLFAPVTYRAVAPAGYKFTGWVSDGSAFGETSVVFPRESVWNYADTDVTSSQWKTSTSPFKQSGMAPIGYGKSSLNTTVSAKNKLAYYFNRTFTLAKNPSSSDVFTLNYTIDDGFVIYVNGVEAARYNMPSGTPGYNTAATTYAEGNPDAGSVKLSSSLFKKGTNYIAVEVHNNSTSSSDIMWDAELLMTVPKEGNSEFITTEEELEITTAGNYNLMACYEPISDDELIANGTTPIKINEVSAANTMAVNDNFSKKDWIELYNTTEEEIDVAGMYLSDDENNPKKYQIPSGAINTIIQPYGHLVIWADEKAGVSQLHANFKLGNNDGEKVILMSEDETWKDCLTYTVHSGVQSVGLYPDGSNNVYVMDAPTIGTTNKLDSYANFYATYVPDFGEPDAIANIPVDRPADVVAEHYYGVSGSYLGTSRTKLVSGVYIVKYIYADGHSESKKVLVK